MGCLILLLILILATLLAGPFAPLVFGGLAQLFTGFFPRQAPIGTHPLPPSVHEANGFQITFLIMLVTLIAAGILMGRARATYASDVATAAASEERDRSRRSARLARAAAAQPT